jgi:ATP-dependent RNA circularization protein (DNA/RNA ligase family)
VVADFHRRKVVQRLKCSGFGVRIFEGKADIIALKAGGFVQATWGTHV